MPAPTFDLQSHSVHSDGTLPAAAVIAAAAEAGLELVALTDHDTVAGIDEALEAGAVHGVRVVPATELSVVDEAAPDIHVLGYGIDHRDPAFLESLGRFRDDRLGRADRMIERLRAAGWELDETPLDALRADGVPLGRPHLAEALLAHPGNTERLAAESLSTVSDVIRGYLIDGKPGFSGRTTPTAAEAIDVIHRAGGVAVWAHPFWDVEAPEAVAATLERFVGYGIDGVEAFYVEHDEAQTRFLVEQGTAHDLLLTGSADFHGHDHKLFARFRAFELHGLEPRLGPVGHP